MQRRSATFQSTCAVTRRNIWNDLNQFSACTDLIHLSLAFSGILWDPACSSVLQHFWVAMLCHIKNTCS